MKNELVELIEKEIRWCEVHPIKSVLDREGDQEEFDEYEKGFITGLRHVRGMVRAYFANKS